jgi:anionic cell wall polymer biosynthesis LytR-Cps2A-Psr (LCP) family protein
MGRRVEDQGVQGGPVAAPETPEVWDASSSPTGSRRRATSKRRRRRVLAAILVLWAAFAALVAYGWHQYGRLSQDLHVSNGRVGAPAKRALTPVPPDADRQTTLVAGIDASGRTAGSGVLLRTDATRHAVELMTVPPTVRASSNEELGDVLRAGGLPGAIDVLGRDLGLRVNHILLMRVDQAGAIVRALSGITIHNPARVPYRVPGATGVFPAGRVSLTGRTVEWYLDPVPSAHRPVAGAEAAGDFRQAAVIRGVTDKLVHQTTPSSITAVGRTISHNFTTDLSPDTVLGMVAVRLRAHTLVRCHLPVGASLADARSGSTVSGFRTASAQGSCTTEKLQTTLPGAAVAATIIATLVEHGGSALLYWSVVTTIALLGVGLTAWVLMLPSVRGVRRPPRGRALSFRPERRVRLPRRSVPELLRARVHRMRRPDLAGVRRSPYARRSRVRAYGRIFAIRILSVPASIGVGILIAHILS